MSCDFFYLLLSFFFFVAYSQPSQTGCLPYFHTWCGLSANLGSRSETCCARLAGNTGRKKIAKNSPSAHHRTTLSGYIFSTEKNLLNSNISPTGPHNMVHFGPTAAEIVRLFGAPQQISTGFASWFRYCSDVAERKLLCTTFGRLLHWCTIYTFSGALAP